MSIPKIIHYCWFGGKPLDELALKCIASWKKYFPNYEIIEWNENNFDINQLDFMQKAYEDKKWAFVSDVVRLLVIYKYGGIYFDTDVEVVSSYEDVLNSSSKGFLGFEKTKSVATGLGFGAEKEHPFIKELIEVYKDIDYRQYADNLSAIACPILTTNLMKNYGYVVEDKMQKCCDFVVYPSEYFSPIEYKSGRMLKTKNTHSIHWYSESWKTKEEKQKLQDYRRYTKFFGERFGELVYQVVTCLKSEGIKKTVNKILGYLKKK